MFRAIRPSYQQVLYQGHSENFRYHFFDEHGHLSHILNISILRKEFVIRWD